MIWIYTSVFLILSIFLPNNKAFFVWSTIYVVMLFWKTKSWEKVVVFGYWPMAMYYVGQLYVIRVIQPEELNHPLYPDGRSLYFKFTPLLMFGMAMIVSWLVKMMVEKIKVNWLIVILLAGVFIRQISSMGFGVVPWWMHVGNFASELTTIIWIWWTGNYLSEQNNSQKTKFWKYMEKFFKLVIIISSLLVIAQGIKGSGIGLVVEQSEVLPFSDAGSDSGGWLSRPIGLWSHANIAAFYIFGYWCAWIIVKLKNNHKFELNREKWMLIPLLALVWLQSRSVYLAMVPIIFWWWIFYGKEWQIKLINVKIIGYKKWLMLVIMFVSILVVSGRFWNSVTNFGADSGWETRARLDTVAIRIWMGHFWFGVGENNFIPVAFREDMSGIMKYFPESVHNGWLLLLTEQGILGLIASGIFIIIFINKWWKWTKNNLIMRWFLLSLMMGQFIVMLFQPFIAILTEGVSIGVLLLFDDSHEKQKT